MSETALVYEFRDWAGRGGVGRRWEVRCRPATADDNPTRTAAADNKAKAFDWRDAGDADMAKAPEGMA